MKIFHYSIALPALSFKADGAQLRTHRHLFLWTLMDIDENPDLPPPGCRASCVLFRLERGIAQTPLSVRRCQEQEFDETWSSV